MSPDSMIDELTEELAKANQAIASLTEQLRDKWMPMSTPPTGDKLYLIFAPSADKEKPLITAAWWSPESNRWEIIARRWADAVTHWMELPNPPIPS